MNLLDVFRSKRVLLTGHTGFKGSWLTCWLQELGAEITGISISTLPTTPSLFEAANIAEGIDDCRLDVRNLNKLRQSIDHAQPDFIFHFAAQSLVRKAYDSPIETFQTNVVGTANLLESLTGLSKKCVVVIVTSDKCYDNVEWLWGYRENDRLGGKDPYSASKAAAELIIRSYVDSFFPKTGLIRIGVGRAGNVIGGGDWADDRIVPDCFKAWAESKSVEIRSPFATRPWQNVLEPLSGYLLLAANLTDSAKFHGEPFNFGPPADQICSVKELVGGMARHWLGAKWQELTNDSGKEHQEAGLLKLNCDKALHELGWRSTLTLEETIEFTAEWYRSYYSDPRSAREKTSEQIWEYHRRARERGMQWTF